MSEREDHPLRNEDYLAISEENRRLISRNKELEKNKQSNNPPAWATLAIVFIGVFCFFCGIMSQQLPGDVKTKKPTLVISAERNTECYFTRHAERANAPWDPYYVLRSPCEHCENEFMVKDSEYVKFPTQMEAWNFIKSWNVPACGMEK